MSFPSLVCSSGAEDLIICISCLLFDLLLTFDDFVSASWVDGTIQQNEVIDMLPLNGETGILMEDFLVLIRLVMDLQPCKLADI